MSSDDSIRPRKYVRRNRQADLLCRLLIDHQLEFGRLFDGQFSGLGALQDLVHVGGYAPVAVREVRPVGMSPPASAASLKPIVGIFAGCCAWAELQSAKSMALRAKVVIVCFIGLTSPGPRPEGEGT
jgi:hypothetical protein